MPAYLLPSLQAALKRGSQRRLLTVAVAGWCDTCAEPTSTASPCA